MTTSNQQAAIQAVLDRAKKEGQTLLDNYKNVLAECEEDLKEALSQTEK
jgi:hypothetical protein